MKPKLCNYWQRALKTTLKGTLLGEVLEKCDVF
jgi:hypothetical protein